jgi:hypothetical protein
MVFIHKLVIRICNLGVIIGTRKETDKSVFGEIRFFLMGRYTDKTYVAIATEATEFHL